MSRTIAQFTVVVRDYDEAIAFYVGRLGFQLLEDSDLGGGKRWVRVRPAGAAGAGILLARAVSEEQRAAVGRQTGGRVGAFIETDDFERDYRALVERGVEVVRPPSREAYGTVAVFADLYGNRFDLIEPTGRRGLADALELPAPAPVEASARPWRDGDGFVVQRVEYRGDEDDPIAAFLFLPRGAGPFAAVVAHHQHNSEWHLGKSEVAGFAGAPTQAFAPALARRGVVVLAPDALTFEERRRSGRGTDPHERDWLEHYNEMAYRLVRGGLLLRKLLSDAMRALTVLASRPEVDPARVGVVGHSVGGITALYHAAVDARVAFGCASGAASSLASRMARGVGITMMEVIPAVARRWTTAGLLAEAARGPFLVASADTDPYSLDAAEVVREARAELDRRGWPDRIEHLHAEGAHPLDQRRFDAIVDWLSAR